MPDRAGLGVRREEIVVDIKVVMGTDNNTPGSAS
jgi:hypothetical protein